MTTASPRRQGGFSLIEILITVLIMAFALLGLAGFVTKATALTSDAAQRARALTLLDDMTTRLRNNGQVAVTAGSYVTAAALGASTTNCGSLAAGSAALDLCQWNNLLFGTQDTSSATQSAFMSLRGCITRPNAALAPNVFVVTVAWGSLNAGVPPADTCGQNAFGDDSQRRVVRTTVRIPDLVGGAGT